jgi:hypothetical protein
MSSAVSNGPIQRLQTCVGVMSQLCNSAPLPCSSGVEPPELATLGNRERVASDGRLEPHPILQPLERVDVGVQSCSSNGV